MGVDLKQNADGSLSLHDEVAARAVLKLGGPATPDNSTPRFEGSQWLKLALKAGTDTGGGVLSWQNNLGHDIVIERAQLDITTIATAACSLDVGETATNGTTAATNLFSAQDVHSATGLFDSGAKGVIVPAGKWVTASTHSGGASAGLAGFLALRYRAR